MKNILNEICEKKKALVEERKNQTPLSALEERLSDAPKTRNFATRLISDANNSGVSIIAELKKASPSKGLIRKDFNPTELAIEYEKGGASCISVLTDYPYFKGKDEYLIQVKNRCSLPLLRKDFMVDPYQIVESRILGADCILIIMAALDKKTAIEMDNLAKELNMSTLVEVHDEHEMDDALTYLSPSLLGINNRNLKTMEITLETTERLVSLIDKEHPHIVCESGIFTKKDIERIKASGVHSFLIGESLMRQDNIAKSLNNLIN